jgi:L-lysine exporter family protein LysE/ArgO
MPMLEMPVLLSAAALMGSQIVSIGPQNAFILRQGLARSHILPIIVICIVCDILLVSLGVLGLGRVLNSVPGLITCITLAGAGFIAWMGYRSLVSSLKPRRGDLSGAVECDRRAAIRTVLAVTLLNPYVWLDTVVIIGGLSAAYGPTGRVSFMIGSLLASALWFCTLGGLSGFLARWFEHPASWRILDGVIACVMFATAISLLMRSGLPGWI